MTVEESKKKLEQVINNPNESEERKGKASFLYWCLCQAK